MSENPSGVAAPAATAPPPASAPTQTAETSGSASTPTESTPPSSASTTQPSESVQPQIGEPKPDSEGLKNLRDQYKSLKKDFDEKYRPVHDEVEELGGLDTVRGMAEFHNNFVSSDPQTFHTQGAENFWQKLWEQNPQNVYVASRWIASRYPEWFSDILQGGQAPEAQPQTAGYQAAPQTAQAPRNGQTPYIPDDQLDLNDPIHQAYRVTRDSELARRQQEHQASLQKSQAAKQEAATIVYKDLLAAINNDVAPVAKQAGWDDDTALSIKNDIRGRLENHEAFMTHYTALQKAKMEGRQPPLGTTAKMEKIRSNIAASVISRHTQAAKANGAQVPKPSPRIELNPTGSAPIQTMSNVDMENPQQREAVFAQLAKQFPNRR